MLRRTTICFPVWHKQYKENTRMGRRLAPTPIFHEDHHKDPEFKLRFKDVGRSFERVWVCLGTSFRRRRTGRTQDVNDQRYYWRPIPQGKQRLYLQRFRQIDPSNPWRVPDRLIKDNKTFVRHTHGPLFDRARPGMYGTTNAPPKRPDFEYRVF